jgi:amino acid transporter
MTADAPPPLNADEQRLAELGYKQELNRSWSGFQNFAISFTIISVLAGCFTTYYQAWQAGGPIAISWGWPIISVFILIIALCMSELVSAMPTAGGIYYWSSKLGGPVWGWFTGWFNLLGLIAILASVDYFAGQFLYNILGQFGVDIFGVKFDASFGDPQWHALTATFVLFVIILCIHIAVNIRGSHLVAIFNGISVWWHVGGVAVIIALLVFAPSHHQSFNFVFTHRINNTGFNHGSTSGLMFWFYVLPLGFLLTQYTITGFDASAHISEETHDAAEAAPKGVWRSVFYSAIIGYVLLLAVTFTANDPKTISAGFGSIFSVLAASTMGKTAIEAFLLIAFVGQMFCGMSCMTSASRMMYAFSRDGAVPGYRAWSRVNAKKIPFNAVIAVAVVAVILTLPALFGNSVAYVIPIFLRLRMGSRFVTGPWTLGKKYKWMCTIAVLEVIIVVVGYFDLPFYSDGTPFKHGFTLNDLNYTPFVTGGVFIIVGLWWLISARKTFTGPRVNVDGIDAAIGSPPPVPQSP